VESLGDEALYTEEESCCEENFTKKTTRDCSGRFVVQLPKRKNLSFLHDYKNFAIKRQFQLEKRLSIDIEP
jgi:hypothetical protein